FEIGNDDAPPPSGDPSRLLQPIGERSHAGSRLQRVLRRDQPPHLVEVEVFEGKPAQMQMAAMGGVERTAQQPNPAMAARSAASGSAQGRTCPVPRTRYL